LKFITPLFLSFVRVFLCTLYNFNTKLRYTFYPTAALYLLHFNLVSYNFLQQMLVSSSNVSLKISTFGSRDIVGHVAVSPAIYGVLWVVRYNHRLILHGYGDLKTEEFVGYDLDLMGSCDHWTCNMWFPIGDQL